MLNKIIRTKIRTTFPLLEKVIHTTYTAPTWIYGSYKLATTKEHLKIVLGSSGIYDKGWIPVEQAMMDIRFPENWVKRFKPETVDAIMAEHVLEHLSEEDCAIVLKQAYRIMSKKSYFRIAVPDGFNPNPKYIADVKPGGTGWGADSHLSLHNYQSFSKIAEGAGFNVKLLEYYDENGKFHFVDWSVADGKIFRSRRFDERNAGGKLNYTSLIFDAVKE